jgi:hypothetical protein
MANFFSRFRRQPSVNNANKNLERNVGIYVQSYLKNRNTPNKVPPINNYMARALHKYINTKRFRVSGAGAAAAGNAGATPLVQANIATAGMRTPPGAAPSTAGNNAARAAQQAGATPLQITAAAAGAAQQQALGQNKGPNAAQQAGAEAAANAAQQARPNASAAQQAQTAAAGAAAAKINRSIAILRTYLANHTNNRGANTQIELLSRYLANANGKINKNLRNQVNARIAHLKALSAPALPTRRQSLLQQGLAKNLNYARFARTLVNTPNSTSLMGAIANAKSKNIKFNRNKLVTAVEKLRGFGQYANKNQKITNTVERLKGMNTII